MSRNCIIIVRGLNHQNKLIDLYVKHNIIKGYFFGDNRNETHIFDEHDAMQFIQDNRLKNVKVEYLDNQVKLIEIE